MNGLKVNLCNEGVENLRTAFGHIATCPQCSSDIQRLIKSFPVIAMMLPQPVKEFLNNISPEVHHAESNQTKR